MDDDEENLSMPVASKKIKHFLNESQGMIEEQERLEWQKVEEELINMDIDTFENWKKIAIKYFKKTQKNVSEK